MELYSTNQNCVKMLVGNKVDRVSCVLFLCNNIWSKEMNRPVITVKSFHNEVFENKNYEIQWNMWLWVSLHSALRKRNTRLMQSAFIEALWSK